MAAKLEALPNETIEYIVTLLSRKEVCNLRQTCRILAVKTSQNHWKSFYYTKHVELTRESLEAFVDNTQPGRGGCFVQDLVLNGVVYNPHLFRHRLERRMGEDQVDSSEDEADEVEEDDEELDEYDPSCETANDYLERASWRSLRRDVEYLNQQKADLAEFHDSGKAAGLLSQAFTNIKENGPTKRLNWLSLVVVVYRESTKVIVRPIRGGSWRYIWKCAAQTFQTTMRALSRSGLTISVVDMFHDLLRCSVGGNEICLALREARSSEENWRSLKSALANLEHLSLSWSDKVIFNSLEDARNSYDPADDSIIWGHKKSMRTTAALQEEAHDEDNFSGLAQLLEMTTGLRSLHLHQYELGRFPLQNVDMDHWRMLRQVSALPTLPISHLQHIELWGLQVQLADALALIKRLTSLQSLNMTHVQIHMPSSERWEDLFEYCTSENCGIESFIFRELVEGGLSVYFLGDEVLDFVLPAAQGPGGSTTLSRRGAAVKKPIEYYTSHSQVMGSPYVALVRQERYRLYGPPAKGVEF